MHQQQGKNKITNNALTSYCTIETWKAHHAAFKVLGYKYQR